jgi:hypothetical protein
LRTREQHDNECALRTEATTDSLAWAITESGVPLGKVMTTDLSDTANASGNASNAAANEYFIMKQNIYILSSEK